MGKRPIATLRMRALRKRSGRRGATILELVMAVGIFVATVLWTIQALLGASATNRVIMTSMTANQVLRSQIEEVYGVATDFADFVSTGERAQGVIFYYGTRVADNLDSTWGDDALPIGPNGQNLPRVSFDRSGLLTYRFVLPEPGYTSRAYVSDPSFGVPQGNIIPYGRGIGEMVLYLDESLMPGDPTNPASDPDSVLWHPLGANSGLQDNERDFPVRGPFDLNDLEHPDDRGFSRIFADVTVTYYADPSHNKEIFTTTRRVLISGEVDTDSLYEGGGAEEGGGGSGANPEP